MITLFKKIHVQFFILALGAMTIASCSESNSAADKDSSETAVAVAEEHGEDDGHNHGAEETQSSTIADAGGELDWCVEHSLPESGCTYCNPSLIAGYKESGDWCGGHDIPESLCKLCNPEIVFPQELEFNKSSSPDWCLEHSLPESGCTYCNPSLIAGYKESGDWCGGHDIPESLCKLCNPEIVFPQELEFINSLSQKSENDIEISLFHRPNASTCATDGAIIQFASSSTVQRVGITSQRSFAVHSERVVDAPAEIVFDETKMYVVSTTVPALISRWLVSPGDIIEKGMPLAQLQAPEVSQLKSDLVNAEVSYKVEKKEFERHSQMRERNLISEVDFDRQYAVTERARVALVSAKGLLLSAGLNDGDINEVIKHGDVSNRFTLTAQSSGILAERIAQLGEQLDPGSAFAILADPASMWVEANLTEEQLRLIEVGQTLTFVSDGKGLNRIGAEVIWVSRFLDEHTRTGTVRARVIDSNNMLQAGEFGRARIIQSGAADAVVVPKDAVQWEGCCNVVFVKETDQRYRPRKVQFIDGEGSTYQITSGIFAGQEVVVDGAFLLKTELKKSSIGAGCCEVEPAG